MRVILCTGKGGVGKTTMAAASALRSAELGYRTIILSSDSAHSLADSFNTALGNEPKPIATNLWGQEPEISQAIETQWGTVQRWLSALLEWRGMEGMLASEMAIFPGMEELANLLYIVNHSRSGEYDVIIVDCAPTGETFRFLSFPEILRWWMVKLLPIERKAVTLTRPLVKRLTDIPVPDDEVFDATEELLSEIDQIRVLLKDRDTTSVRLVVNPEKMVINEAQRTFTYLNLYGYFTDLVICNRLIPDKVDDRYFNFWKKSQSKYYKVIEEAFAPLPIASVPLLEQEVVGIRMLKVVADALYGEDDPTKVFFRGQTEEFHKEDEHYILTLALPFINKGDISLAQNGDELAIRVGNFNRNIILPRTLVGLTATGARFEGDKLRIDFPHAHKAKKKKGVKNG